MNSKISVPDHEWWWGGAVADGEHSPLGQAPSPQPCDVERPDRQRQRRRKPVGAVARLEPGPLRLVRASLRAHVRRTGSSGCRRRGHRPRPDGDGLGVTAFRDGGSAFFPASGAPSPADVHGPQYNTWIEMPYRPTQPACWPTPGGCWTPVSRPGVLMIDDRWSIDYGTWTFDPARSPTRRRWCAQLHDLGFTGDALAGAVRQPGQRDFRSLPRRAAWSGSRTASPRAPLVERLQRGAGRHPPGRVGWLHARAERAVTRPRRRRLQVRRRRPLQLPADDLTSCATARPASARPGRGSAASTRSTNTGPAGRWAATAGAAAARQTADLGRRRPGLAHPGSHRAGPDRHPFICPDMIGGGDLARSPTAPIDSELFVRYAQCAALFPMMQFSVSPGRVLDGRHLAAVMAAVRAAGSASGRSSAAGQARRRHRGTDPAAPGVPPRRLRIRPSTSSCSARTSCVLRSSSRGQCADRSHSLRVAGEAGPVSRQSGPAEVTVDVSLDTIPHWRRPRTRALNPAQDVPLKNRRE